MKARPGAEAMQVERKGLMPARLGRNDTARTVTPGTQVSDLGGNGLPRSAIVSL